MLPRHDGGEVSSKMDSSADVANTLELRNVAMASGAQTTLG